MADLNAFVKTSKRSEGVKTFLSWSNTEAFYSVIMSLRAQNIDLKKLVEYAVTEVLKKQVEEVEETEEDAAE